MSVPLAGKPADRGVMYAIGLGNGSARMALGQPVQRLGLLMFGELWFASHVSSVGARRHASLARSLVNAKALVLGHGGQERDEAAADGRGQIQVRLVQHLDERAPGVDALDECNAVHHAARRPVPLGDDEHIAGPEW